MLTIIFIAALFFWIIYYIMQGMHDTNFLREVEFLQMKLSKAYDDKVRQKTEQYEINWKLWDSLEKTIAKLVITLLIYLLTDDLIFSVLLLCLSIIIRWIVHDITVAIALRGNLKHIGPEFVWTDKILRRLAKSGINQYVVKLIPAILLIVAIIYHISAN